MFKAHIIVTQDTNVAVELAKIENLAKRNDLDDITTFSLLRNVEAALVDLKKQDSETAEYGINLSVKKTVAAEDYNILLELQSCKEPRRKRGLVSRLFGR